MKEENEEAENEAETNDHQTVADGGRVTDSCEIRDPVKALLEDATGL